jgi:UDP-N-acetylglucosamine 2-epimerase (non-hydrolysing)
MKKIILVVGARPNFMKIAPLMHQLKGDTDIKPILVHTGQHYDSQMSGRFFEELGIPAPDINLEVGSASHAEQTAKIMIGFEKVCLEEKPDFVLVVGDVNSTVACTLVAAKLNIKTIHYEAGLRSHDRTMPEEINRLVTDSITDYFFTTSVDADENLIKEGVDTSKIFMVGNLMIDTLEANLKKAAVSEQKFALLNRAGEVDITSLLKTGYGVMTFHRPSNVDEKETLETLVNIWGEISGNIPLVFPIHPRTMNNIKLFGLMEKMNRPNIYLIDSLGYLEFIHLVSKAKFALTDSGGIQEETTHLNIPCLTVRPNTERPVTIWEGSNKLIGVPEILSETEAIIRGEGKLGQNPKYWDGKTAERIIEIVKKI